MEKNMKVQLADGVELHIRKDKIAELIMERLGFESNDDKPVKRPVGRPKKVKTEKVKTEKVKTEKVKTEKVKPKKVKYKPMKKRRRYKRKPVRKKDILKAVAKIKIGTANEIRVAMGLSELYKNRVSVHISELKSAGVLKSEGRRPLKYSLKRMTQEQFADEKFKAWWENVTGEKV